MADIPRLDHALLTVGECDERAELDDLLLAEVLAQPRPEGVVDAFRVPDEVAREEERRLLPLRERVRALELEQLAVVRLVQLVSRPERPLRASVLAADRLRDVDTAELLQRMLDDAPAEDPVPTARERLRNVGDVRADRLRLRARRAEPARPFQIRDELGIGERRRIDIADACDAASVGSP